MSRYIADYTINKPDDLIKFIAEDFLTKEGFRQTVYKGETVWKKGVGAVSAPQFIKLQYGQGNVHLEAWIKSFGEHGVTGFYGALPKSELNSRVQTLVRLLSQEIPATQAPIPTGATAADSFAKESPTPAPVPVAVHNPTNKATISIITGILSILTSLFIPLIGVILGIIAISTGRVGKQSTAKGLASAGFVTGIIGLVISAAIWILNFVLSFVLAIA